MVYETTNVMFVKMLNNLLAILEKGAQFADSKKIEMEVLLQSRLAPDQFPLIRQIRITCDTAKLGASRLTGKEVITHDDTETTLAQLKTRIHSVIEILNSFSAADYSQCMTRKITTPRWEGKYLTGEEYVLHHVVPNFYFHLTTAYAILRHNGVDVGKSDYLGELPFKK